jgi:hypothetical protein
VASLTRSITPYSLYTPHTGTVSYTGSGPRIPAAAITVEDAELLWRFQSRGQTPILHLFLDNSHLPDSLSRNGMLVLGRKTLAMMDGDWSRALSRSLSLSLSLSL